MFCGISNLNKKYLNTIERLNVKNCIKGQRSNWECVNVQMQANPAMQLTPRQGLGVCQVSEKSILIIGGFGGKYTNDSFEFNVFNGTI